MPSELDHFHNMFNGSVRWRVTDKGVEVEGKPIVYNQGHLTVNLIIRKFMEPIRSNCNDYGVPIELVIACIATESSGNTLARREEPGYVSEKATPNKVSLGLMQLLISTAKDVCRNYPVDGKWLVDEDNNIMAGTRFIASKRLKTSFDPPLVAASYNAGGVYLENNPKNRWRMRCFPMGTGKHIDRFVSFYNDAKLVLSS